jgi:guanosine-3',5'-bis(diphosphate) 3'-pyrophosphohydrolase
MHLEAGLLSSFTKALAFAAEKHRRQQRKDADGSPYINHPIALSYVLTNEGGVFDSAVLCAALLHDTIEDTDTSEHELTMVFGADIAAIVVEVTDDKSLDKHVRKQRQIEHAAHLSSGAKLVKLADKICNLRDLLASPPADWSAQRKRAYFDWAGEVIAGVRGVHPQLETVFDGLLARQSELG